MHPAGEGGVFGGVGQLAMEEEVGDIFEVSGLRQGPDGIAAVAEIPVE